jgi:predicted RNA-binding protein with PIN domain
MSVQYLLDGYNIIHQLPVLARKDFDEARAAFVRLIEIHRPQGSVKNSINLIFDGKPGLAPPVSSAVKIIFTQEESADDRIKRMVDESSNPRRIIVVTDDRAIQYSVRSAGAKVMGVQEFGGKLTAKDTKVKSSTTRSAKKPDAVPKVDISAAARAKINQELERIWIKKDKIQDTRNKTQKDGN